MLVCSKCGSPGLDLEKHEIVEEDEEGYVIEFKEKYECENCGATGTLHHKDSEELRRPKEDLKGSIKWKS